MKKVKRWEWTHDGMWDNDANDGEYVLHSDYEKLQKENEALKEKLAEYENHVCIENLEV